MPEDSASQRTQKTLSWMGLSPFAPPRLLSGSLTQTILPVMVPDKKSLYFEERRYVSLSDGDQIALAISLPKSWKEGDRIVFLLHGLAGCEGSPYIIRIGDKLLERGYGVIKFNHRSCGPGRGLAKNPYHCGRSEDARDTLKWIQENFPHSPITQVGFSLSANITVKMLGEPEPLPEELDSAVCVSPPLDLQKSAQQILYGNMGIFDRFFVRKMRKALAEYNEDFPTEKVELPRKLDMKTIDNLFTAPRSGFENADHYYDTVAGKNFIPQVKTKTLLLYSTDDPVVTSKVKISIPDCVDIIETSKGGHVGFVDRKGSWMDRAIIRWIDKITQTKKTNS